MELLLIRHGEADPIGVDGGGATYGDGAPLTALGRRQAELLGKRLAAIGIDYLYASTVLRAKQTAEIAAPHVGKTVVLDRAFREIDTGQLRAAPRENIQRFLKDLTAKNGLFTLDFSSRGGEGPAELVKRASSAVHELVFERHGEEERVAVVTHGGFINAALCALMDVSFTGVMRFSVQNTAINTVRVVAKGHHLIVSVNDYAHLAPLAPAQPGS
ncbi:MAG: histidine phosphatase family protein [Chloroflexi bacterium]|nr:histidine phosphatase family protein [Chloroflexota bacterium]